MFTKIEVGSLKVGMYLQGLSKDSELPEETFMNTVLVKDDDQIRALVEQGYKYAFVYEGEEIDFGKAQKSAPPPRSVVEVSSPEPLASPDEVEIVDAWELPVKSDEEGKLEDIEDDMVREASEEIEEPSCVVEIDEELSKAKAIKDEASEFVGDLMSDVRAGKGIEGGKAQEVVGNMVDSVLRNQDALSSLARLKDHDNYTFGHSVNVSILTISLGRQLDFSQAKLEKLGLGAILHDVGKMLVPDGILNKPGKLTIEEFAEMKRHVDYASDVLSKSTDVSDDSIYVSLQHHERYDGQGYNGALTGTAIHEFGRIACVADVYDAMTTKRVYGNVTHPNDALKTLFKLKGRHFDPGIIDHFIACLGIYPIGSFVELNTGEIGQVRDAYRRNLLAPTILVLFSKDGTRYASPVSLNLATNPDREIIGSIDPVALKLDLTDLTV